MPTYQIKAPNGNTYRIVGPPGASREQVIAEVLRQNPEANMPPKNAVEKVIGSGAYAAAADLPLNIIRGATNTVRTITDVAGADNAASSKLREFEKFVGSLTSAYARQDEQRIGQIMAEAENKGLGDQASAALKALKTAPLDLLAQGAGSLVPFVLGGLFGAGIRGVAALGAASGAGTVKSSIYDGVKQELIKNGVDAKRAEQLAIEAQSYAGDNLDQIAFGTGLGAAASITGAEKGIIQGYLKRIASKRAAQEAAEIAAAQGTKKAAGKAASKTAGEVAENAGKQAATTGTLRTMLVEGGTEGAQGGQEQLAQNIALQREGVDVPTWQGVAGQATLEGALGAVLGGAAGSYNKAGEYIATKVGEADAAALQETFAKSETKSKGKPLSEKIRILAKHLEEDRGFAPDLAEETARQRYETESGGIAGTDAGGDAAGVPGAGGGTGTAAEATPTRGVGEPGLGDAGVPAGGLDNGEGAVNPAVVPAAPTVDEPKVRKAPAAAEPVALPTFLSGATQEARVAAAKNALGELVIGNGLTLADIPKKAITRASQLLASKNNNYTDPQKTLIQVLEEQGVIVPPQLTAEPTPVAEELAPEVAQPAPTPLAEALPPAQEPEITSTDEAATTEATGLGEQTEAAVEPPQETPAAPAQEATVGVAPESEPDVAAIAKDAWKRYGEGDIDAREKLTDFGYTPEVFDEAYANSGDFEDFLQVLNEKQNAADTQVLAEQEPLAAFVPEQPAAGQEATASPEQVAELEEDPEVQSLQQQLDALGDAYQGIEVFRSDSKAYPFQFRLRGRLGTINLGIRKRTASAAAKAIENGKIPAVTKVAAGRAKGLSTARSAFIPAKDTVSESEPVLTPEQLEQIKVYKQIEEAYDAGRLTAAQAANLYQRFRPEDEETIPEPASVVQAELNAELKKSVGDKIQKPLVSTSAWHGAVRGIRLRAGKKSKGEGVSLEEVQTLANAIQDGLKSDLKIVVLEDIEDAPKIAEWAGDKDILIKGVLDTDSNRLYIFSDNLDSLEDATATIFHEALGHAGLKAAFRDGLDRLLNQIYTTNTKIRAAADTYLAANKDAYTGQDAKVRATEEVLAEMAEEGQLPSSLLNKLKLFFRTMLRRIGFNITVSDAELAAMLQMAHDAIVNAKEDSLSNRTYRAILGRDRINGPAQTIKLATAKAQSSINKQNNERSQNLKKVLQSESAGLGSGIAGLINARSEKPYREAIEARKDSISTASLRKLLKAWPTSSIIQWQAKNIPELKDIADIVAAHRATKTRLTRAAGLLAERVDNWIRKHGQTILGRVQHLARLHRVDPTLFDTLDAALAGDAVIRVYDKLLADPNTEAKKLAGYKGKITRRQKQLREVYKEWDKLGQQEGGRELYKEMREYYRNTYFANRVLLDRRIKKMGLSKSSEKKLLDSVRLEQELVKNLKDEEYAEVDASAFPQEYFPFRRYGNFWLSVPKIKGKNPAGTEFYMFESAYDRDMYLRQRAKELGISHKDQRFDKGDDAQAELRRRFNLEGSMLQQMFDTIEKVTSDDTYTSSRLKTIDEATNALRKDLRDALYQTYLMTLPERMIRKQFIHSENITGFSPDVGRNLRVSAAENANQMAKLTHSRDLELTIKAAYENINGKKEAQGEGKSADEKNRLRVFLNEIVNRADEVMNPEPPSKGWNRVNRFTFLWLLTSPATAITQMTSLPIRVYPRLVRDHGVVQATAMMTKHSALWNTIGTTEKTRNGVKFNVSVLNSALAKSSPPLNKGLRQATDSGLFETPMDKLLSDKKTIQFAMGDKGTAASAKAKVLNAADRSKDFLMNATTALFRGSERISREAAFAMAFDLAYSKAKGDADAKYASAYDYATAVVDDTLGNYTDFERPSMFGRRGFAGEATGAVVMFKQYAVVQTKFFLNNIATIFSRKNGFTSKEKRGAIKELTGVLLMAALFGGAGGLPLYDMLTKLIDMWDFYLGDEEDVRKRVARDPLGAYNSDYYFRNVWLPDNFGEPKITGLDGKPHSLGDVLVYGPVSELSNINIGSRTSFSGLWFREALSRSDTTDLGGVFDVLTANIPALSVSNNMLRGMNEVWDRDDELLAGETKGLEKMLPAFAKGPVAAVRLALEGARTSKDDIMLGKETFSSADLAAQALGFQPTDLAEFQKFKFKQDQLEKEVTEETRKLLGRLNRAIADPDGQDPQKIQDAIEAIREFNSSYGNSEIAITGEKVEDSLRTYLSNRQTTVQGVKLNKRNAPSALRAIKNASPE